MKLKTIRIFLCLALYSAATAAQAPPVITHLNTYNACAGSDVVISGTGLANPTSVTFGGTPVQQIVSSSDTQIVVTLRNGTSGPITVTTNNGSQTVSLGFVVNPLLTPSITSSHQGMICPGMTDTLSSSGAAGNGIQLSGTDQYISTGTPLHDSSSFTKEAWIKTSFGGYQGIIASDNSPLMLIVGSRLAALNGDGNLIVDTVPISAGEWTHVAVTYDSAATRLTLYKNGIIVATDTATPGCVAQPVSIGQWGNLGSFFNGEIDEVRIWNVARNNFQIITGMNNSVPENSEGLVAYYKLDEGTDTIAYNSYGLGLNGALINQPARVTPSDAPINYEAYSWLPDGDITPSITVTPNSPTTYTLTATDVNGCVSTNTILVDVTTCTGIDALSSNSTLQVYPDPASSFINVVLPADATGENRITVYDVLGKDVSGNISLINKNETARQLNIASLPSGIYFLQLKTTNGVAVKRFTKQ